MNRLLVVLALLCISMSFSQSKHFEISGTLLAEEDRTPLESATVYLQKEKDSSLITYTISDKNGEFMLENKTSEKSANMFVSYVGYNTYFKKVNLEKGKINLKEILMQVNSNALDEVVIKSAAPVTIKKDTLEFNVKSFKTKKDATVEDLLKQLPGVEVDDEGQITVNGKPVNKILVNGKPFFGDDPTITTKNLTKEIIDKIQVVDTKSKSESFTGETTDGENKTINLTISEDKNKGVFGRVAAGVGTDERYEAAGMLNYFNNDRRLSVLAGGNNINSPGFSFGEIRKMFGGARSMSMSSNGTFTIDGRTFGGGQGITESRSIGANYADVLGKKDNVDISADYFHSGSSSENETASQRENILPDSRYFTNSNSVSNSDSNSHSVNMGFDVEIDSTFLINVDPSFRFSDGKTTYNSRENSRNQDGQLTNDSYTNSYVENQARSFSNRLNVTKRFGDKGGYIRMNINNEISTRTSDDYLNSETNIYGEDVTDPNNPDFVLIDQEARDQYTDSENEVNTISSGITYRLPIVAKSLFLNFQYNYSRSKTNDVKTTLDRSGTSNEFTDFNQDLSTDFEYLDEESTPGISINYNKDKFYSRIGVSYLFRTMENTDFLRPQLSIKRKFENMQINSYLNYRFGKNSSVYFNYRLRNEAPQLSQLQAFQDVSNPLNTVTGNPNLDPSNNHRLYFGFNSYNFQDRTGFYSYFGAQITDNQVVSKTTINDDLVRETTYTNVNGNYNVYGGFDYDKRIKLDSIRTVKLGVGVYGNFNRSINYNNDVQYAGKVRSISPELDVTFEWKDIFEIRPRYSVNFTKNTYDIEAFDDREFLSHELRLRTAFFLPKNFEWRNDINYVYNPNVAAGFQRSAWFWNATLAYSFLKDKMTATLKVYDLLDQNTNARRTATQNYIQDSQSTVLKQYFMLSLSWKFNSLGKKGEVNDRGFWRD
ncbi:outer membrane beta-barrel protein [Mangrovimonas spongiae]|uniref:TonB-dependent receptor n=1 Tax=Mangrovimonas spongiae TaxID=2494697 RepID=A0A3R9NM41_9FLAO|nr:outer membrane beta-barrel protein [Mangrovimonas spongiae]RSK39070.1 TonB-dependent receptor [Mangrovimonas spongiae]